MYSKIIFALSLAFSWSPKLIIAETVPDLSAMMNDAERKCLNQFKSSEEQNVIQMIDGLFESPVKCFVSCLFEEAGLMTGTELNTQLFDDWLKQESGTSQRPEDDLKMIKSCFDQVSEDTDINDKCDKAYEYYLCLGRTSGSDLSSFY